MRQAFIVTYDVSDSKRLRKVFRIMKGAGAHLQLSVFRCELTASQVVVLRDKLGRAIHAGEDQVLFIDIGPVDGRGRMSIESLGRAYIPADDSPVVV